MDSTYIASRVFLTVVGGLGNVLMLITLRRDKTLRARLSSLMSIIMGAQAVVDATFCLVGVPLLVLNQAIGEEGATSLGTWFCYATRGSSWRLVKMSFWMLLALAATRFAAVYFPIFYRRYATSTVASIVAVVAPVVSSQALLIYGLITNWIRYKPLPGRGDCFPYVVDNIHPSVKYTLLDGLTTFAAVPIALALYLLVWVRLFWSRLSQTKVGPAASTGGDGASVVRSGTTTAAATANNSRKLQQDRVRLMTLVFAINLALILPNQVMYFGGFKPTWVNSVPLLVVIIDWLIFFAIAVNPLIYAALSAEIRVAFKRTLTCA